MLVLSRYQDESIHIGNNIVVTVVEVRGDRVRLGIEAPKSVTVHRQEIFDAIKKEQELIGGNNFEKIAGKVTTEHE